MDYIKNNHGDLEISLKSLMKSILSHTTQMILLTIVLFMIIFTFSTMSTTKFNLTASIQIRTPNHIDVLKMHGITPYSIDDILLYMTSNDAIKTAAENIAPNISTLELNRLHTELKSALTAGTNNRLDLNITTSTPDLYIDVINELLENKRKLILTDKDKIETALNNLNMINKQIEQTIKPEQDQLYKELFSNYREINILNDYLNELTNPFSYIDNPDYKKEELNIVSIIAYIFISGLISLVVICIECLRDKHIYTAQELTNYIDKNQLLGVLPVFRNIENASSLYFDNIAVNIPREIQDIDIISIDPKSGKTFISNQLNHYGSFCLHEIHSLDEYRNVNQDNHMTIVIVKAGSDITDNINIISNSLKADKTRFIINLSDSHDAYLLKTHTCDNLRKRSLLISRTRFYRNLNI